MFVIAEFAKVSFEDGRLIGSNWDILLAIAKEFNLLHLLTPLMVPPNWRNIKVHSAVWLVSQ
jgi:hypothetical protein